MSGTRTLVERSGGTRTLVERSGGTRTLVERSGGTRTLVEGWAAYLPWSRVGWCADLG
ncbi:hypothetical protein [Kibdelosporangium philippinense]|uniref:hypothetical protein n=1 Tax=Kibdelosporangium philippinense TaxID=211113 RepID=UPI00360796FE